MALTQEAAGEALGEAGVRPLAVPGARRLCAGGTNPPGSRPGCRGGPHGHPPTPAPAPAPAGAAPVRAWRGRGAPRPRPHAGYSPPAPLPAPRAPPPPTLPLPAPIPDTRSLRGVSSRPGVGPLLPHRPWRAPCPATLGDGLGPHRDELAPRHGHGARLAPGSRSGCGTRCGSRAGTGCAQPGASSCPSVLQRSTGQPLTLQGTNKSPPIHQRDNRAG